jgi:hypothetical protein
MSEPVGTGLVSLLACYYFDLELGQKLEAVYPPNHDLSKEEERIIGFHAFPVGYLSVFFSTTPIIIPPQSPQHPFFTPQDSMSFELHVDRSAIRDSIYTFQLERNTPSTTKLYGFVFCRQRQDESLPRGGEQRSVVVLSPFPISSLLLPFTQHAGCTLLASSSGNLSAVLESLWQEQVYNLQPIHGGGPLDVPIWGARVSLALGGTLQRYTNTIIADLPELSTLPPHCAAAAAALAAASTYARNDGGLDELVDELDDDTGLPLPLIPLNNNQENHHGERNNSFSQDESSSSSPAASVMGGFAELDIYTPMSHALHHLWTVWELLMVGEPLMVVSPFPSSASFTVAALSSLIAPLPYTQPQRPYFTIHDPAFAPLVAAAKRGEMPLKPYISGNDNSSGTQLPLLIGVTNQFIIKSLLEWGNIIGTGYSLNTGLSVAQSGSSDSGTSSGGELGGSSNNNGSSRSGRGLLRWRRGGGGPGNLVSSPSDGAWFDYRPLTRPDKELLASLIKMTAISDGTGGRKNNSGGGSGMGKVVDAVAKRKRAAALNSATIKRHFQELTRAVLFPLLPLISPVPPSMAASPYQLANPPALPIFDAQEILEGLKGRSARVPDILLQRFGSQKSVVSFYERFLKSPIFTIWLKARQAAAAEWQRLVWRAAWRAAGGPTAAVGLPSGQEDVGAIEEFFSLEQRLSCDTTINDNKDDALVAELRILFEKLPTDLQSSLILNPKRRSLLLEEKEGGGERE